MIFVSATMEITPMTIGFRFLPIDEELVSYYLPLKDLDMPFDDPTNRFQVLDLYNYTPEQLRGVYGVQKEREMYIFTKKVHKHQTGKRLKRTTTSNGHWRASTKEIEIRRLDNNELIGHKRSLVYYTSEGRETKTNWLMHEYRLPNDKNMNDWLLCKVYLNGKEEIKTQVNLPLEPPTILNPSNVDQGASSTKATVNILPESSSLQWTFEQYMIMLTSNYDMSLEQAESELEPNFLDLLLNKDGEWMPLSELST